MQAGLAFCPETSESMVTSYLDKCDLILLMTVKPGFGGQSFMDAMLEKIKFTRAALNQRGITPRLLKDSDKDKIFPIQVDGGINLKTAKQCIEAGANDLVAGTYVFKGRSMEDAVKSIRNCI